MTRTGGRLSLLVLPWGIGEYCRMPDVIVLAIDTCDARGSVAVLRDAAVLKVVVHESQEDYSTWLLPAVRECVAAVGLKMAGVAAYAVAAGPARFTGVRGGVTTGSARW